MWNIESFYLHGPSILFTGVMAEVRILVAGLPAMDCSTWNKFKIGSAWTKAHRYIQKDQHIDRINVSHTLPVKNQSKG